MKWNLLIFIFLFIVLSPLAALAQTLYMPDNCADLHSCFQAMRANDTLIIRDGTYSGANNTINQKAGRYPPNGTGNASDPNNGYTIIKAENDGQVTIDGKSTERLFYLNSGTHKYFTLRGMKFINPSPDAATRDTIGIFQDCDCHHIKLIRIGAQGIARKSSAFVIRGSYILLEESYAWGEGRYGILIQWSNHVVVRRCVVRLDAAYGGGMPIALYQSYASKNVEWQNNIAIDSNTKFYTRYSYISSAFSLRKNYGNLYSENNQVRGNIVLNVHHWDGGDNESSTTIGPAYQIAMDGSPNLPNQYEHNIGWDVSGGIRNTGSNNSTQTAKNMTFYLPGKETDVNSSGYGVKHYNLKIRDSIIVGGEKYGIGYGAVSDYNLVHNNADDFARGSIPGNNDYTIDNGNAINPLYDTATNPLGGLKYIVRIENGSNISNKSSTGKSLGATVLKRYGVSGTHWGEPGYKTLTNEDLWPFPYEDQIKADFATYNPGGADTTKPDGKRGFAADGVGLYGGPLTLTSYIWEYLGNPCPVEVCGTPVTIIKPPVPAKLKLLRK